MQTFTDQKGAVLVEFTIVLIPLLILLFASVEFSILFFNKAMLTNASREGARIGIVYNYPDPIDDATIETTVSNYCQGHLITFGTDNPPSVTISPSQGSRGTGADLIVTASYVYDFLVLPNFVGLPQTITLTAETVMRME